MKHAMCAVVVMSEVKAVNFPLSLHSPLRTQTDCIV